MNKFELIMSMISSTPEGFKVEGYPATFTQPRFARAKAIEILTKKGLI